VYLVRRAASNWRPSPSHPWRRRQTKRCSGDGERRKAVGVKVNRTHRWQLELSEVPVSNRHLEQPHEVQVPHARAEPQGGDAASSINLLHGRLAAAGPLHGFVGDPRHAHRVSRPGAELVALHGADQRAIGVERPDPNLGVGVPAVLARERVDDLLEEGGIQGGD
jgi:hypothetical protein